ncbi:cysteine desulfurase family protein [Kineococcus indalonis]|uniref:cysteine desulfurase family protein n=1 Tax=Kineococcus indalonis TaxID=2696566 RepID=UPI0014122BD1|nr:cysteine desulfurase family protein [Kineococcus indalonis]NAZ86250.1 aminotransferase class V-fold PLP-dependent enzyme [Kineococcus indalonis]
MTAYLDHASTTPLRPEALEAWAAAAALGGNPSSLHSSGRRARAAVEESREALAAAVGARPGEVVWTSGGTEADNLALKGLYWARRDADPRRRRVLVGAAEHHAVLDCAQWLAEHEGADVRLLPVDALGRADLDALRAELAEGGDEVALVSLMWANNEVGTVQPVAAAAELARAAGVPVHTDAVQAVGHLPVDFAAAGVDALSLSAHKFGGPVGVGALVLRRGTALVPLQHGGGQELGVRSGTLDAPAARAAAAALTAATAALPVESARTAALRDRLVAGLRAAVDGLVLRGDPVLDAAHRLPGNAHVTVAGCEGDSLLYLLDAAGVECSTGSACQAGVARPSHVLLATGLSEQEAAGALRFSLGWSTTDADVDAALAAVGPAVERARRASTSARTSRARRRQSVVATSAGAGAS